MLNDQEKTILFSTVRIMITNSQEASASIGTGFIVSVPVPGLAGKSALFIVSNKHVFVNPEHDISIVFTKRRKDAVEPQLGSFTLIAQSDFTKGYVAHPNADVDLACICISSLGELDIGLYFRHYSQQQFIEGASQDLTIGQDAFFIGYPDNRFDVANNLPLVRKGCIASAPNVDFNGEKKILIDAHVFPGSSGSPVFVKSGEEFKIIGVISETMISNEMTLSIPPDTVFEIQQYIGLGIVLKISLVEELLAHAVQHIATKLKELCKIYP